MDQSQKGVIPKDFFGCFGEEETYLESDLRYIMIKDIGISYTEYENMYLYDIFDILKAHNRRLKKEKEANSK